METITIAYSPAINALAGAIFLKLQLMLWLNQTFVCTKFKEVNSDAKVYIFIDSEANSSCGSLNYGEYLGCHYATHKIFLNEGTLGLGKHINYVPYLKGTWIHEWQHELVPTEYHSGNELKVYLKENC